MARRFWPGESAVGKTIRTGEEERLTIIGVAGDIKYYSLGEPERPYVYLSFEQFYQPSMTLELRVDGDRWASSARCGRKFRRSIPT